MRSILIYASHHQGNTEKLVRAIAKAHPVRLLDAQTETAALAEYDLIGFASGIDFGKFYPAVTALARTLPAGKAVYALFTCARTQPAYGEEIRKIAQEAGCTFLGKFGCKGFNTYGPWKLIGGMNRAHPSPEELAAGVEFYEQLLETSSRKK